MNRMKTLSLPLISALVASATLPADAQLSFDLSSQKTYRQNKNGLVFQGGTFNIRLDDGHVATIGFCDDPNYYPPGFYIGTCSPGTTGFLTSGNINGATIQRPYLLVTELAAAVAIEPGRANAIRLTAAPASALPRPSGGFTDDSSSVFYNLHTTAIEEYGFTGYFNNRRYSKNQRGKFEAEIVPGVYHYSFPRLGFPEIPAPITAVIYPMAEGLARRNNQVSGFQFTQVNRNRWNKDGFIELSFLRPNVIKWTGLTPSTVYAGVDDLYISMRALRNPQSPNGSDVVRGTAIFPAFNNQNDPRVLLPNPYIGTFTTPPIFPSGTKAILELELQRNFQTGGVTYDFSNRRFQIPVEVTDRYTEYAAINLANQRNRKILADSDRDGYNNLTEWILDSNAGDPGSIPEAPFPAPFQAVNIVGTPTPIGSYFGFNVDLKTSSIPKVRYRLQRSRDQGKTWETFRTDPVLGWTVNRVTIIDRGITSVQIQVRSTVLTNAANPTNLYVQPPGTLDHLYRVKVTLAK